MRPAKSAVERLCGSNEKARRLAGWEPRYTLDEGLEKTVAWFRGGDNLARYKADIYNL